MVGLVSFRLLGLNALKPYPEETTDLRQVTNTLLVPAPNSGHSGVKVYF